MFLRGGLDLRGVVHGAPGELAAGLVIIRVARSAPPEGLISAGLLITATCYAALWLWPQTAVLLPGAALLGFGFGLINVPFQTLIQQQVPQGYLGRVFSVLGMVSTVGMPLTLLLVSPLLDRTPLHTWFSVAAIAQAAGWAAWQWGRRPPAPGLSSLPGAAPASR